MRIKKHRPAGPPGNAVYTRKGDGGMCPAQPAPKNPDPPRRPMAAGRKNLLFAAAVAALALALLGLRALGRTGPRVRAVLTVGEGAAQTEQVLPLDKDARYDIAAVGYTIHLEVANGRIRFVDSPCPDHTCEGFGWLSAGGDWAACLPARAALRVEAAGQGGY